MESLPPPSHYALSKVRLFGSVEFEEFYEALRARRAALAARRARAELDVEEHDDDDDVEDPKRHQPKNDIKPHETTTTPEDPDGSNDGNRQASSVEALVISLMESIAPAALSPVQMEHLLGRINGLLAERRWRRKEEGDENDDDDDDDDPGGGTSRTVLARCLDLTIEMLAKTLAESHPASPGNSKLRRTLILTSCSLAHASHSPLDVLRVAEILERALPSDASPELDLEPSITSQALTSTIFIHPITTTTAISPPPHLRRHTSPSRKEDALASVKTYLEALASDEPLGFWIFGVSVGAQSNNKNNNNKQPPMIPNQLPSRGRGGLPPDASFRVVGGVALNQPGSARRFPSAHFSHGSFAALPWLAEINPGVGEGMTLELVACFEEGVVISSFVNASPRPRGYRLEIKRIWSKTDHAVRRRWRFHLGSFAVTGIEEEEQDVALLASEAEEEEEEETEFEEESNVRRGAEDPSSSTSPRARLPDLTERRRLAQMKKQKWTHVVCTYDPDAHMMNLYLNGKKAGSENMKKPRIASFSGGEIGTANVVGQHNDDDQEEEEEEEEDEVGLPFEPNRDAPLYVGSTLEALTASGSTAKLAAYGGYVQSLAFFPRALRAERVWLHYSRFLSEPHLERRSLAPSPLPKRRGDDVRDSSAKRTPVSLPAAALSPQLPTARRLGSGLLPNSGGGGVVARLISHCLSLYSSSQQLPKLRRSSTPSTLDAMMRGTEDEDEVVEENGLQEEEEEERTNEARRNRNSSVPTTSSQCALIYLFARCAANEARAGSALALAEVAVRQRRFSPTEGFPDTLVSTLLEAAGSAPRKEVRTASSRALASLVRGGLLGSTRELGGEAMKRRKNVVMRCVEFLAETLESRLTESTSGTGEDSDTLGSRSSLDSLAGALRRAVADGHAVRGRALAALLRCALSTFQPEAGHVPWSVRALVREAIMVHLASSSSSSGEAHEEREEANASVAETAMRILGATEITATDRGSSTGKLEESGVRARWTRELGWAMVFLLVRGGVESRAASDGQDEILGKLPLVFLFPVTPSAWIEGESISPLPSTFANDATHAFYRRRIEQEPDGAVEALDEAVILAARWLECASSIPAASAELSRALAPLYRWMAAERQRTGRTHTALARETSEASRFLLGRGFSSLPGNGAPHHVSMDALLNVLTWGLSPVRKAVAAIEVRGRAVMETCEAIRRLVEAKDVMRRTATRDFVLGEFEVVAMGLASPTLWAARPRLPERVVACGKALSEYLETIGEPERAMDTMRRLIEKLREDLDASLAASILPPVLSLLTRGEKAFFGDPSIPTSPPPFKSESRLDNRVAQGSVLHYLLPPPPLTSLPRFPNRLHWVPLAQSDRVEVIGSETCVIRIPFSHGEGLPGIVRLSRGLVKGVLYFELFSAAPLRVPGGPRPIAAVVIRMAWEGGGETEGLDELDTRITVGMGRGVGVVTEVGAEAGARLILFEVGDDDASRGDDGDREVLDQPTGSNRSRRRPLKLGRKLYEVSWDASRTRTSNSLPTPSSGHALVPCLCLLTRGAGVRTRFVEDAHRQLETVLRRESGPRSPRLAGDADVVGTQPGEE